MKYTSIRNNLNIIKKLVFILILFAFGFMLNTNTVKADTVKEAYLLPGDSFFSYFNLLSNNATGSFRRGTLEEYNNALAAGNNMVTISTSDSPTPAYMWGSGNDTLYYTEADKIYLNPDCSGMFYWRSYTSIDLSSFDTSRVTNMSDMFRNIQSELSLDLRNFDTGNVTNMSFMFFGSKKLTEIKGLEDLDTGNVTNMSYMFADIMGLDSDYQYIPNKLGNLDLSKWNTSKVTDMSYMFHNNGVTELDISNLNTSNVTNMSGMFSHMFFLDEIKGLEDLNTSNVTNMQGMFEHMYAIRELDVSTFDTSKVTNMDYMFRCCENLRSLDISSFSTDANPSVNGMFTFAQKLRTIYATDSFDNSKITSSTDMFYFTNPIGYYGTRSSYNDKTDAVVDSPNPDKKGVFTDPIHKGEVHSVTYPDGTVEVYPHNEDLTLPENNVEKQGDKVAEITLKYHDGVTSDTTLDVLQNYTPNGWNIGDDNYYSNQTILVNKDMVLEYAYSSNGISAGRLPRPEREGYSFIGWYTLEEDGEKITEYYEAEDITLHAHWTDSFAELVEGYDFSSKMNDLIYGEDYDYGNPAKNFRKATLEEYNLVKDTVENAWDEYGYNKYIISSENTGDLIYAWKSGDDLLYYSRTDNILFNEYSSYMFGYLPFETIDISEINPMNVTNMSSFFNGCSNLTSVNFGNYFDTRNVTIMSYMFSGCSSLTEIDLSALDTRNVTDMTDMFNYDQSLESVYFGNIDTSKVTNARSMFGDCNSLTEIDLSNQDLSSLQYANYMFRGCSSLTSLNLSNKKYSNIIDAEAMFSDCTSLEELDLSRFDTSNLMQIGYMFNNMTNLRTIYVSQLWDTSNIGEYYDNGTFDQDTNLVGGQGTVFDNNYTGREYARIDDPDNGNPGYLTYREYRPKIIYPDGRYQEVEVGYVFTFPNGDQFSTDDQNGAAVTLKNNDGTDLEDITYVKKHYVLDNWKVNGVSYDIGDTLEITTDTYLEPQYIETSVGADLKIPHRLNFKFDGWYTEAEGGELVESYNGEEDITLYAHWSDAVTSTLVDGWTMNALMANKDYNTFRKATLEEYNNVSSTLTSENIISTDDSDVPTYYWIENGDFVYYSEADIIYLNEVCQNLFSHTRFKSIDLSGLDSFKMENAVSMFSSNDSLTSINLTNFDTSNLKNALDMFSYLPGITELDVSNFDTRKVETAQRMFYYMENLEELDISSFDMSNTTDLLHIFCWLPKLTTVYVSDKWDVSHVGNLQYNYNLFYYVPELTGYYGTEYNAQIDGYEYAKIDEIGSPGYFTDVSHKGETHSVTYPDGTVEVVKHNKRVELEENTTTSDLVEDLATITFKLHNGEDDIIKHVQNVYRGDGFLVNNVRYDDYSRVLINEDKTIEYNYTGYPESPEFPEEPTDERRLFLGWYTEEDDGEFVDYYDEEDDITLHAHWSEELLKLTIDGETTLVEPGYVYTIPNGIPTNSEDFITIYLEDNYNDEYKEVKISYGNAINYQRINGTRYYPGDTYVVNEDTTIVSNKSRNKTVVMDPYVEEPTYSSDDGDYVFKGWIMKYWDYVDPIDINIDIYSLTPKDVDYNYQTFLADFELINEEEQARVTVIDDYRRANYTYIVQKGLEIPIENISSDIQNSRNTYICNNVNDDCIDYNYDIDAIIDHYVINGTDYPNGEGSYTVNEDTTIEVVRSLTENEYCGDNETCPDIIYTDPYTRVNFDGEDYIYTGMYFDYDEEVHMLTLDNLKPSGDANGSYGYTVYMHFVDGTENVIVSIDDDYNDSYVVPKGMGTVPAARDNYVDEYDITFKYEDGETPDLVKVISVGNVFTGYRYWWNTYEPGDEFNYQEDTNFSSQYDNDENMPDLPTIDDEHFKGWYNTSEYLEDIYPLYDMHDAYYNYIDYGTDTYYAHWGEPTVEVCHGKGDCEEVIKGTVVTFEQPEPTVATAHFTLDYNTEEPGYPAKEVTTTRTDTVEYYMINGERYDFGETYVFNENCDMYGVTTSVYTSDFVGYYNDNWDYGLNINGYELRGWCATTDGRYCRYYDENDDILQPDGLTLYASYWQSEGDTVQVTVDWNTTYEWPKGESELIPDEKYDTIEFDVPGDYPRNIDFDLNDGSGNIENGSILVHHVFSGYRVGNDDSRRYQRHDLYTFYRDIHIQSQYEEEFREIEFPDVDLDLFKGWYTLPEGGRKITNTEDFVKYMDPNNSFVLYAQYYEGLPTDFDLDTDNISMSVGDTHIIEVTFIPEGSGDTLTYTDYDDIISITDGIITALEPGETTITVGTENTDIEKTITVTIVDDLLESEVYEVKDKVKEDESADRIVIGSEPGVLVSEYKENMTNPTEFIKIYDTEGNEVEEDEIVKTGLIIKLEIHGTVHDEAVIIVRGDINGDGLVNIMDKSKLSEHILRIEEIEGYGFYAADVYENDLINIQDKSKLSDYILRVIDSLNEKEGD